MTLSSRHRIRNSSPGGLRSSTLPLGHGCSSQYWLSHVDGEETFLLLSNRRDREPNPELWRERVTIPWVGEWSWKLLGTLHIILGNCHTYVCIHCAYQTKMDNVNFCPWNNFWLTQILHAHKGRPCQIQNVYMWLIDLVDPKLQSSYKKNDFSLNGHHYPWVLACT